MSTTSTSTAYTCLGFWKHKDKITSENQKINEHQNQRQTFKLQTWIHKFNDFFDLFFFFLLLPVQVGVSLSQSPGLVAWPVRPSLLDGPSLVSFRVSPERDEGSCWAVSLMFMRSILMKGVYSCWCLMWEIPGACISFLIHLHLIPLLQFFFWQQNISKKCNKQPPWTVFNALRGLPLQSVYAGGLKRSYHTAWSYRTVF